MLCLYADIVAPLYVAQIHAILSMPSSQMPSLLNVSTEYTVIISSHCEESYTVDAVKDVIYHNMTYIKLEIKFDIKKQKNIHR